MTRRRDKQATQSEILAAASELFSEQGYAATSLTDVAKLAGVTKSLIHHHFGTKDQLWLTVAERLFEGYREFQLRIIREEDDDLDNFIDTIRIYFEFLKDNPQMRRMQSWMALEQAPRSEHHHDLIKEGMAKLARAQQRGEIRSDLRPELILLAFLTLVQQWFQTVDGLRGAMPEEKRPAPGALDEPFIDAIQKIFADGLRSR